mgnify:CR=1 FL=1
MKKKVMCMLLTGVMAAGMFAGCGSRETADTTNHRCSSYRRRSRYHKRSCTGRECRFRSYISNRRIFP